jgi:hypothetical protein
MWYILRDYFDAAVLIFTFQNNLISIQLSAHILFSTNLKIVKIPLFSAWSKAMQFTTYQGDCKAWLRILNNS